VQVILPMLPVQVVPSAQSDGFWQVAPHAAFVVEKVVVALVVVVVATVVVVGASVVVVVAAAVDVGGVVVADFTQMPDSQESCLSQRWHDSAQDPFSETVVVHVFLPPAPVQSKPARQSDLSVQVAPQAAFVVEKVVVALVVVVVATVVVVGASVVVVVVVVVGASVVVAVV
jgi:hypothetical protein